MPGEITQDLIARLPKTDLHCHLDGSLRLDTVIDLARRQGIKLPTFDRGELHAMLAAGEHVASLDDYLRAFDITLSVMQAEDALERTAYELAEDAWRENVRYLEVRYSPLLHTRQGLRPAQVVEAVLRGLRMAKRELGIRYGVILCAIRTLGPESSLRIAELRPEEGEGPCERLLRRVLARPHTKGHEAQRRASTGGRSAPPSSP